MEFPVKKLVINNYKSFETATVDFEKYTVFVTFGETCVGLADFIDSIHFVFCYDAEVKAEDISKLCSRCSINPQTTFVNVQVCYDGISHIFERKIVNDAFVYMHDEVEVSIEYYTRLQTMMHLRNENITLFVDLNVMNSYVNYCDMKRSEIIEEICGSNLDKQNYDNLDNRLQINKEELNYAMQRQRYLKSQRNEFKKRKVLTDNLSFTKRKYEENRIELYYFKLFHNKNVVTMLKPQLIETQNQYDALLRESFKTSKSITENEKKRLVLYNELKSPHKTLQELGVQMKKKVLDSSEIEEQIKKLEDDIIDLNYVVGQNNVKHIEDSIKKLEDRLKTMEGANEHWSVAYNSINVEKYSKLQMEFDDKFPEMILKSRSSVEEMKLITIEIDRYNQVLVKQRKFMENLQNSINKLNRDILMLEEELKKAELNRKHIQNQRELIEDITRNIENAMQSRIDEMYNNTFGLKSKQLENIVEILKSNISGVYGRISEFSRTPNASLQEALKCRFGFRYEAIIVDTKETAHECIALLKSLKFNEHNETFLFLSGLKLRDTENFMIDKEGVKDIKFEYIESVLSKNIDSIKDALISCASKTVFCKTYDDAVKVFDLEKNNVNVVSTDDQLLFERSGFITKESKVGRTEISDIELNDLKVKKLEAEEKVRELTLQPKTLKMNLMTDILVVKKKLINIIDESNKEAKEITNIQNIIDTLTLKYNALKFKSNFERNTTENEFFAEFCEHLNFSNIEEYRQKMLKPIASTTIKGINDRLNASKKELAKKKLNNSMLKSLKGSLNFLSMSLLSKRPDNRQDSELKLNLDLTKRINREILAYELQINKLNNNQETIYDKLMEKQLVMNQISFKKEQRLRENYEVLLDCKKNMIPLQLVKGSLNDVLYLPEKDAFINDLMHFRLERIDVNFDYLSEELKNANGEETCEKLSGKFNEIETELKLFPAPEGNLTEKINFFSTKLVESTAAVNRIKTIVDRDEKEFSIVKKIRLEKFLDCLDDLNDSVLDIYVHLKNNTTSTAFFSMVNEEEPFNDGIKLTFWNNPQMDDFEDEIFIRALSFLLSVVRVKGQRFVIFNDVAKFLEPKTVDIFQKFFSTEKEYQLVFFTSRPEFHKNSHYAILQRVFDPDDLPDFLQPSIIQKTKKTIKSFIFLTKK